MEGERRDSRLPLTCLRRRLQMKTALAEMMIMMPTGIKTEVATKAALCEVGPAAHSTVQQYIKMSWNKVQDCLHFCGHSQTDAALYLLLAGILADSR